MLRKNLAENYSPLYFLAALGAGGLAISFFMYPYFMIKGRTTPMPTFETIWPLLTGDNPLLAGLLALDLAAIAALAFLHFRLLAWNFRELGEFRRSAARDNFDPARGELSLMAIPLTLAMTVNVCFVLGALFVPGLWSIVEWLFPGAMLAFLAIGIHALRILLAYFGNTLTKGGVDFASNNSLAPMIAIFTLAMIAVGLAAPAAMSQVLGVQVISMLLSLFFFSAAVLLAVIKLVIGFRNMFEHGINVQASPSLWIIIPIVTLLGIAWIRLSLGMTRGFELNEARSSLFVFAAVLLSVQILFGLIGWTVMRRLGYFTDYVWGRQGNAGTFSLICPGVALFVFGFFFLSFGLVHSGLVEHLSPLYFIILLPFSAIQIVTLYVMFRLQRSILTLA
ncbi:hypothetical protein [Azonexus sp.]|uniref:TsoY family (seleno)protein n=1 Tax=Azonexus sp. TaxID=1872668 RepID=UPI0035B1738B